MKLEIRSHLSFSIAQRTGNKGKGDVKLTRGDEKMETEVPVGWDWDNVDKKGCDTDAACNPKKVTSGWTIEYRYLLGCWKDELA